MKKTTKATVKAALKGIDTTGHEVIIDFDTVTVWFESASDASREKAETIVEAICQATNAPSVVTIGQKTIVYYKRPATDMGDYNDKSSRWHY